MKTTHTMDDERGFALIATLLLMLLMITLGSAAILYSSFDLKATNHYNTGNQAMYSAEAGLQRALNAMNSLGVVDFNRDVVQRWSTVFGPSTQTLPGYNKFSYQVTVVADATKPSSRGTITATGFAPSNAKRVIRGTVQKSGIGEGRGALYLAADSVSTQFSGNGFNIDGNDYDQYGKLVAGGAMAPGIATRNDRVTSSVKSALNTQQKDNVRGEDFSLNPLNPSVVTTNGPSVSDLDQIISSILTNPYVVNYSDSSLNGNTSFGTVGSPQITHLTNSDVTIKANGNASGAGILIADGSITINGRLNFTGWIIVRGDTIINDGYDGDSTTVLGNATILGSLWTGDMVVKVGGSAIIDYCTYCLSLIDNVPGANSGYFPKAMVLVSWEEVL